MWILYSLTLHVFLFNTGGIAGGIFSSSSRGDFNNVTVSLICPSVEEDGLELSSEAGTSKHIIIFQISTWFSVKYKKNLAIKYFTYLLKKILQS